MIAQAKRNIKTGREFDKYFPKSDGKDTTILKTASIDDTMRELKKMVFETTWQTKEIAQVLKGANLNETCKNIFNWVYAHIDYRQDHRLVEQLREPARLWKDRAGDCDCYTIMISSILLNLQIPHLLRITKYKKPWPEQPYWQHIYPIVPKGNLNKDYDYKLNRKDYITIDCVTDYFDYEVPYLEKRDYKMELARLSGFGNTAYGVAQPTIVKERQLSTGTTLGIDENENVYMQITPGGNLARKVWIPYGESVEGLGLFRLRSKEERKQIKEQRKEIRELPKGERKAARKEFRVNKPKTKVGKAIRKVASKVNKVNPAATLLRNGLLAAMKIDMMGVARKMRFAFINEEEAKKRGMDIKQWKNLKNNVELKMRTFENMGGKRENFKNAILKGKGNKKDPVLSGFNGLYGDGIYEVSGFDQVMLGMIESELQMQGLGSLGEPVTASAIAAATASVTAWAASLKRDVKELFPGGMSNPLNKETEGAPSAEESTAAFNAEISQVEPEAPLVTPQQVVAIQKSVQNGSLNPDEIAKDATGEDISPSGDANSWVKPALIGGSILAAAAIAYMVFKPGEKKAPSVQLSGVKKKKKKAVKSKSKSTKKLSVIKL